MEDPKPMIGGKLMINYQRASFVYAFSTFESAKEAYNRGVAALLDRHPSIFHFEHISGTAALRIEEVIGLAVIDRVREDDVEVADVPYRERLEERSREACGHRVGIGIN